MKTLFLTLPLLLLTACGGGSNDEGENPGDCSDNIDNDSDGQTDCFDAGCSQTVECLEDALTGEKGDKGDQGDQGEQGPQGEPGQDGIGARTMFHITYDVDGEACVNYESGIGYVPEPSCCPSGFTAVGAVYLGSHAAICLADDRTSRTTFIIEYDATGTGCAEDFPNQSNCCPTGFTHVGFHDLWNPDQLPICLED